MAADITIIGNQVTLESSIPIIDQNQGLFWQQRWAGSREQIDLLLLQLNLDSDEKAVVDDSQSPLFRVTITTPDYRDGRSNALDKWEVVHNKAEISLKEHAKARALAANEVRYIDQLIKDKIDITVSDPAFSGNDAAILYGYLLKGSNKTQDFERVFKYSVLTSKRYASLLTESFVGRRFTTAQLITPAVSGLVIPVATQYKLLAVQAWAQSERPDVTESFIVNATTEVVVTSVFSWLKQPADSEQLPSGKLRHTQEFWGYRWSTWEYNAR